MRLPCHTVGRASVSRSVIQRRQLCQQGLAAGGFVHPLHHPGGGRLCREAHGLRLLAVLVLFSARRCSRFMGWGLGMRLV